MSKAPPVRTPDALAILEWVDERIERLTPEEEASTFDRVALRVWREIRGHLADTLPYVEAGALVLTNHGGRTYPEAFVELEYHSYAPVVGFLDAAGTSQQPAGDEPISGGTTSPADPFPPLDTRRAIGDRIG